MAEVMEAMAEVMEAMAEVMEVMVVVMEALIGSNVVTTDMVRGLWDLNQKMDITRDLLQPILMPSITQRATVEVMGSPTDM